MLEQKIIEKIQNIFGLVDVYFNVEDITQTNKLAILVDKFDPFPINNGDNIEQYFITADFIFPIIKNNGWSIDTVMNRLTEYNQNKQDKINIVYPYSVSDNISITLEFFVDIKEVKKNKSEYPMKDAELIVTI